LCEASNPCGAPSYSINLELAMPFAAARPAASIGKFTGTISSKADFLTLIEDGSRSVLKVKCYK